MLDIRIGSVKAGDEGEYIGRKYTQRRAVRQRGVQTQTNTVVPASPLANPFPVTSGQGRADVIAKYRIWLWSRIRANDQAVISELGRLLGLALQDEGVTLVCWCRGVCEDEPACHGDIIVAALEWLALDDTIVQAVKLGAKIISFG